MIAADHFTYVFSFKFYTSPGKSAPHFTQMETVSESSSQMINSTAGL